MIVTLKGEAKVVQFNSPGIYVLGPNAVNGKSHWLQDSGPNAIWFDKEKESWNIGNQDGIGGSVAGLTSFDKVASPQEASTWQYSNNGWTISDDILVDTFKPGMYMNRMRIIWVFLKTDMYFHLP